MNPDRSPQVKRRLLFSFLNSLLTNELLISRLYMPLFGMYQILDMRLGIFNKSYLKEREDVL